MLSRRLPCLLLLATLAAPQAFALPTAPGDTSSVVTLFANFDADVAGQTPNLALPGPPSGDYLTLDQSSGTVLVDAQIDGLTMAAQLKQQSGEGGVSLFAWPAAAPAGTEKVTVGWRSVTQDDNPITIIVCALRGSNGNIIASVEYGPHGGLTWNGAAGAPQNLPVVYRQNRNNAFRIAADLLAQTVSLSIDGQAVPGFQNVPFAQPAADVAQVAFEARGTAPQTFAVDDIFAVAFARTPDHAPVVTAPASVSGAEGAPLSFVVTAADPDGEAITSLQGTPIPAGATFTADASNSSGTFAWTPDFAQAGSYSVTFTASNALTGMAVTEITITGTDRGPTVSSPASVAVEELGHTEFSVTASDPDGDTIDALTADFSALPSGHGATFTSGPGNTSGTFAWTPALGHAGVYPVTFTALANGISGTSTTQLFVAVFGTSVTGRFIWTPQPGDEGSWSVTFIATDLGGTTTLTVPLTVLPADGPAAAAPAPTRGATAEGALAPESPMKGPVISISGSTTTKSGDTMTLSATSTTSTEVLAGRITIQRTAGTAAQGTITLTADLSGLPAVNNAVFIVDQDPKVHAPTDASVEAGSMVTVNVGADDPDGDPIGTFTADLSGLPAGHDAVFTTNATLSLATLTWTPTLADVGDFTVTFRATNRLVGTGATTIHVNAAAAARIFMTGNKKLNLASGKPFQCVQIEPVGASFDLANIDVATIAMISPGTGSVERILADQKAFTVGDRDNNMIEELTACFRKADLRNLFSLLRGTTTVTVTIEASLLTGGHLRGTLPIVVSAGGGGPLAASISPNPLNPRATLRFLTSRAGEVRIRLYDAAGRLVRELLPATRLEAGEHRISIDGADASGRRLASGVYLYRIDSAEGFDVGRLAIVK